MSRFFQDFLMNHLCSPIEMISRTPKYVQNATDLGNATSLIEPVWQVESTDDSNVNSSI